MRSRRVALPSLAVAVLALLAPAARAEEPPTPPHDAAPTAAPVPEEAEVEPKKWEFSLTGFGYDLRHEEGYFYGSFLADRDRLHLEARYGYEAPETASAWVGLNFEVGEQLVLEATPMVGAVFGETTGVVAGYELSLSWRRFELYTEGEVLFDLEHDADGFFYAWSELTFAPTERWKAGLVLQRTHAFQTDLDVQRGVLLGLTFEQVDVTAYAFDLDRPDPILALSVTFHF